MIDYAKEWGDRSDETIILLHPAGGSRHNWTPHAEILAEEYHVVSLDLPAHGIHPESEFTYSQAIEDLGVVLEEVGEAVVAGHSQGGYVASKAAAEHGERIKGLLLAGASPNWRKPKMLALSAVYYPVSYLFDAASYSDRVSEWMLERFGEGDESQQGPPDDEDTYHTLRGAGKSVRATVLKDTWTPVEGYTGPVMIAHGKEEPLKDHAEELADRTGGELRWYDGGHQAPMDNTDQFAQILNDFLRDVYDNRRDVEGA